MEIPAIQLICFQVRTTLFLNAVPNYGRRIKTIFARTSAVVGAPIPKVDFA